jgi:hypothetical protein
VEYLSQEFGEKIKELAGLSKRINRKAEAKILGFMEKHAKEIRELYDAKNPHWAIETADLIILCFELLALEKKDTGRVFENCLPRWKKLERMAEKGQERKPAKNRAKKGCHAKK